VATPLSDPLIVALVPPEMRKHHKKTLGLVSKGFECRNLEGEILALLLCCLLLCDFLGCLLLGATAFEGQFSDARLIEFT
jgi:hypothetical protein